MNLLLSQSKLDTFLTKSDTYFINAFTYIKGIFLNNLKNISQKKKEKMNHE